MADKDTSFHGGTPSPSNPDSYGWSGTDDGFQKGSNSYAHPDSPYPPANPVAFGQEGITDSTK